MDDAQSYLLAAKEKADSGGFSFLRIVPPDILRYVPKYLARDEAYKDISDALSWEHEKQRQEVMDVARQFYVDTATWGLVSWEKIFQTNPPADADYEVRRALIKTKMLGLGTMTKSRTELMVNQFTDNKDAYINENIEPGVFQVVLPSVVKWMKELRNALDEMTPAHLVYRFLWVVYGHELYDKADLQDIFHVDSEFSIREVWPWSGRCLDGSWELCDVSRLDGSWELNGKRLLDGHLPDPPGIELNAAADRLGVLDIELSGLSDTLTEKVTLDGKRCLNDGFTLGENPAPIDMDGDIEIKKVHYLDGSWELDGGDLNLLDGSITLDGRATLDGGGIHLGTDIYTDRLDGKMAMGPIEKSQPAYLLHPAFTEKINAVDAFSIVIDRIITLHDKATSTQTLDGRLHLDGSWNIGEECVGIDRGITTELSEGKALDGTWLLDGAGIIRTDGTWLLDGQKILDGGGINLEIKRQIETD